MTLWYIKSWSIRKGEILEGAEDDIRATYYILAFQREFNDDEAELRWRVVDMMVVGGMHSAWHSSCIYCTQCVGSVHVVVITILGPFFCISSCMRVQSCMLSEFQSILAYESVRPSRRRVKYGIESMFPETASHICFVSYQCLWKSPDILNIVHSALVTSPRH